MSNVIKVKLLSERISGVPPVIFLFGENLKYSFKVPRHKKPPFLNESV